MRVKFTIAVCALLMLGLAATQVSAQGFNVSKSETNVAQHGRNQMLGAIRLDYSLTGGNIDDGRTIKITYGGLYLTHAGELLCGGTFNTTDTAEAGTVDCDTGVTATIANDDDTKVGTATINLGTARPDTNEFGFVILRNVRADVSSLDVGDTIVASVNSSTAPTGFVPIGQARTESVGGIVSTVRAGLTVGVTQASRLLCNIGFHDAGPGADGIPGTADDPADTVPIGGVPSITVAESFPLAFEHTGVSPGAGNADVGQTNITIKMNNLPAGTMLRWPHSVIYQDPDADATPRNTWSTLTLTDASRRTAGMVDTTTTMGAGQEEVGGATVAATAGDTVTYIYATTADGRTGTSDKDVTTESESFKIEFTVSVDQDKVGAGGISDIWAWLAPAGKTGDDDDRATVLSYNMAPVTDPDVDEGDIINFTECVTYLLFPYLTCGNDPAWTTAIAIANTTMDDGVFGLSGGAAAQSGSVMLHAFPRAMMGGDGMMHMGDPMRMQLASSLAAGDTYSATCSTLMPGFEGYAIARTTFRHAHGLALVLGNFSGGAALDVAHGYLALVIPDPEFGGDRAPASGESLGQ